MELFGCYSVHRLHLAPKLSNSAGLIFHAQLVHCVLVDAIDEMIEPEHCNIDACLAV